jgi:hypothetical protein
MLGGARLRHAAPDAMLLEEFIIGAEHSFDSVVINGGLVWYSIGRYLPTPLDVLENPWIQWCVLLPRDVTGPEYADIAGVATHAVTSLGLQTGFSHMEWFRRPGGSFAISEVGARPPGAQFMTLMSYAHDVDMYAAWARLAVHDWFLPPGDATRWAPHTRFRARDARHRRRRLISSATNPSAAMATCQAVPTSGCAILSPIATINPVAADDTAAVERALAEIVGKIRLECG